MLIARLYFPTGFVIFNVIRSVPMLKKSVQDATVVGAGPNGLAAAIVLAQAGRTVLLLEANETIGGGARSAELTLPGFIHDTCSAIHPLAAGTHFMSSLPLHDHGLEWIYSPAPLAHPMDDGTAVMLERSLSETAKGLGRDGSAYGKLFGKLNSSWRKLAGDLLRPPRLPRHPIAALRFGLKALRPARSLAESHFRGDRAKALFAGMAAHSLLPLEDRATAAFGLVLGVLGHVVGWPLPKGGSQKISDSMASYFRSLGGRIVTGIPIHSAHQLPPSKATLFNVTPRQLLKITGGLLPKSYRRRLESYRYGPGSFKVDIALDGPIPWRAPECGRAATVHVGGTLEEIAAAEKVINEGGITDQPFVLVAQQSLFDPTRAPEGKHTVWAYCHVPNGATLDMTSRIVDQIERYAPGFKNRILAHHSMGPTDLQKSNANYVGGDINGGVQDLAQMFARPVARRVPYSTPVKDIFICSSSTPPGGGVHGLCGYFAASWVNKTVFK
jgi:phytoene dehydrogenase-like protein